MNRKIYVDDYHQGYFLADCLKQLRPQHNFKLKEVGYSSTGGGYLFFLYTGKLET